VWSPSGDRLAYVARVPEEGRYGTKEGVSADREPPRRITTLSYRLDDVGFTLDRRPQIFVVALDGADAAPVQVTRGDYDHDQVAWSPDGQWLAFVSARHDTRDRDLVADVCMVSPEGGEVRQVTRSTMPVARPAFAPDGSSLVFLSPGELGPEGIDLVGRNVGLWQVPVSAAEVPVRLTEPEPVHLDEAEGRPLTVDPAGVLAAKVERGAVHLVRIGPDGKPVPVLGGRRQVQGHDATRLPDGGVRVAATVTGPTSAGEVVVLDEGWAPERVVSAFGEHFEDEVPLRPMEELVAEAPDGYAVHGWVLRPPGAGPHPVLLLVHGGPFRHYGWALFDEAQVYAGAGYAVVMGNPRGSAGYGEAHGRAIVGRMGTVDADDLLALLDMALESPDLDRDQVGVLGGSYGGWMTTWLIGHTARFRAAVSERAVNTWDSFVGSSDIGWFFARAYVGPGDEAQAAQSPLRYAPAIATPTLIIHSEHDWRCPLEQAQRLYVSLKLEDVPCELLLFPGEGHELSRSGLPSHRVARFDAILDWFARFLRRSDT
jgi:dipeptidyl aminopeptidase/acylaminoacyl peptidase